MPEAALSERSPPSATTRELDIVVIGDSIGQTSYYPARLEESLARRGVHADVQDRTVNGATISFAVSESSRIASATSKPDLVVIALGGNDLLNGSSPSNVRNNLEQSIHTLTNAGIPVMLAGMRAPDYFPQEYRDQFNNIVPDLAKKYGLTYDPLFIAPVVRNPHGMSNSEIFNRSSMNSHLIHPNASAGIAIGERMAGYVSRALGLAIDAPAPSPSASLNF